MAIDFTTMDGYQFEDYISSLFRRLGFEVESTSYSNDGGIDLIATFNQPIFSGKYIIQCKNWTVPVGQPEVRDLYGVVLDQRANKGILITPSDYTQQAYDFANGKNIELINGVILKQLEGLIKEKMLLSKNVSTKPLFRNDRYSYLEGLINDEPNVADNYVSMINYLRDYLKKQDINVCSAELFDTILDWIDKMTNRCFKTTSKAIDKEMARLLQVESYILSGRLAEATEVLLRTKKFWIADLYPRDFDRTSSIFYRRENHNIRGYYYAGLHAWNLYAAFSYIGYEKGCQQILSRLRYTDGELSEYYTKNIFGKQFIYVDPCMESQYNKKTKHFKANLFWVDEIHDPMPFFEKFFIKTKEAYAKEIDEVFKLHGLM